MKVFDNLVTMYDVEDTGTKGVNETVEILDEMLTSAGIAHTFTLPFDTNPTADGKYPVLNVIFQEEDYLEFALIYTRYAYKVRCVKESKIADCLIKFASKFIERN